MGMVAILFNGTEPFEQTGNTLLTEGPKLLKQYHKRRYLNITQFYTCIQPSGKGR